MPMDLQPELDPHLYCFVTVPEGYRARQISEFSVASVLEGEGWSFVLPLEVVKSYFLPVGLPQRRIVLKARSVPEGAALAAAVPGMLARAGIACNWVAAFHRDYVFVPEDRADEALAILRGGQEAS